MSGPRAISWSVRMSRVGRPAALLLVVGCGLTLSSGCRPAPLAFPASLNSQRPEERIRAAKTAVVWPYRSSSERFAALELLVGRLDDEDDAVRFFAILALERLTGTRQGYEYYAPATERIRAIERWRRYLARLEENRDDAALVEKTEVGPLAGQTAPAAGDGARDVSP